MSAIRYPALSGLDFYAQAVVTDPARLAAQKDHREVAIADTYTMIVRAQVNTLDKSTAD